MPKRRTKRQPFIRYGWALWAGILVLLFIASILLALPASAKVVAVAESKGDRVTLTDDPCVSSVLQQIKPDFQGKFMAATYYVGQTRETVKGCYMEYQELYVTIWEDGDRFELPMSFFKQVKV